MDLSNLLGVIPILIIIAILIATVVMIKSGTSTLKTLVFATIGIVLTATVLIPALEDVDLDTNEYTGWQYDDYLECDATGATGAFEIVEIGGLTYVHSKDVGEGTYTVNGETVTETVEIADLDVVLILGQSNAAYRSTSDPTTASPIPSLGKAYYYGSSSSPIFTGHTDVQNGDYSFDSYGMYDVIDSDGECRAGNIESPFAATYDGNKVYMINGAVSGSSTANWTNGGYCYEYAQSCVESALSQIDTTKYTVHPVATLWVQGESDMFMTVANYCNNVTELYSDLADGTFATDMEFDKFLISLTRNGYNADTAQKELASTVDGIYLATEIAQTFTVANGKMCDDDIHYSQKGDNLLGVAFGEYLNNLI